MIDLKIFSRDIDKLSKVRTPKRLFAFIEDEVAAFFEVSYLDLFVLNDSETEYALRENITRVKDMLRVARDERLDLEDPIIVYLSEIKKAILPKELNESLAVTLLQSRQKVLSSLRDELIERRAEICVPGFVKDKLVAVLIMGKKISKEEFSHQEVELFSLFAAQAAKVIYNFNLLKKEVEQFVKSLRKINNTLEEKDPYTLGHSSRVAQFSVIVGRKFYDQLEEIPFGEISLYYAAELHDVGKINLPDSILKKKGPLNDEEYNEMKKHPLESVKIINPLEKWFGREILDAVLGHHENHDGTGYPHGKKGDEINILAKIIRVSDSFDAMISDRPYRKALIHHKVLSELKKGRGTQFDPEVIDAFLETYKEGLFKDIFFSQLESKA